MAQAIAPRLRPPGREGEPQPRPPQVPRPEAGHRGVQAAGRSRSAPSCAPTRAGPRSSPICTPRREAAAPGRAAARRRRTPEGFDAWARTNVYDQRQAGYAIVTVALPLGDLTSDQARALADIARQLRRRRDAHDGRAEHRAALGERGGPARALQRAARRSASPSPGAGTIVDVTRLPRHRHLQARHRVLARPGRRAAHAAAREPAIDWTPAVRGLRIKVSGCFNSCGQHHVADIGFFGNSRNVDGCTRAALPGGARRPVERERRLVRPGDRRRPVEARPRGRRAHHRAATSPSSARATSFQDFIARIGKKELRAMVDRAAGRSRPTTSDPSFYTDWGDPREYTIGDMGVGECAGEVVAVRRVRAWPPAERRCSRRRWCSRRATRRRRRARAYSAMLQAARALVREKNPNVGADADEIVRRVPGAVLRHRAVLRPVRRARKFAQYFFRAHEESAKTADQEARAPADRGGAALRRRRPPVLHRARLRAGRPPPPWLPRLPARSLHGSTPMGAHKLG